MFDFFNFMYKLGGYSDEDIADFVIAKNIDSDQYKLITGKDYVANDSTGAA